MERLNKSVIDELLNSPQSPAVTIYIPMHTTASPPHISENQIHFKNLLHKAAGQLKPRGEQRLAAALEQLVHEVHDDLTFWENQLPGLLICANPDFIRLFQLPRDTEEYLAVDEQFHLAPVLGLLADSKEFYVLTLAQQTPKLYCGDFYGLQPASLSLPPDLHQALNIDENNQKTENQGTAAGPSTYGAGGAPGAGRGWFNGRGGARDPSEEDRSRFFRLIDSLIYEKADRSLPLILAGIESEVAEYRALSKYPWLLHSWIPGNHSGTPVSELLQTALKIVQAELVEPEHQAAIEEYARLSGANPKRVAEGDQKILAAAEQGRIDKLLTTTYKRTADTVRDSLADVLRITFPAPPAARTLNRIAATVWRMSGRVVNLQPGQLSGSPLMVARLRF